MNRSRVVLLALLPVLLLALMLVVPLAWSSLTAAPAARPARQATAAGRTTATQTTPYSLPAFQLSHDIQMPLRFHDLYDFDPAGKSDPISPTPIGNMVQGPPGDDVFYSTSQVGGKYGKGAIFSFDANKRALKVLYDFGAGKLNGGGSIDANAPRGGLSLGPAPDFALFGTTTAGGKYNAGVIFKIARTGGDPQLLYSFHNGAQDPPVKGQPPPPPLTQQQKDDIAAGVPMSAPLVASDGSLYGVATTTEGRASGELYQLIGTTLKSVHRFGLTAADQAANGTMPIGLTAGKKGEFYGVTWAGGLGQGTIFEFDPGAASGAGNGITTLYRISNVPPHDDGSNPYSVIEGSDGNLYGVMSAGGPYYRGVVFELTPNGIFRVLHAFNGSDSRPGPGLVEVSQDDPQNPGTRAYFLYGAASWNASIATRFNSGILFRLRESPPAFGSDSDPDPYNFSTLYNAEGPAGVNPSTTPVLGRDSNFYGMMAGGGAKNAGSFYRLDTAFDITGDPNSMTYTNPDDQAHTKVALRGDPSGRTAIYDDRSEIQVMTSVAVSSANQDAASRARTSDGIAVRVKDVPPFAFWPRADAREDRAEIVQFFYRERMDSKGNWINGLAEAWDPLHSYSAGDVARYNNYYWISGVGGNKGNTPPANQDCVKADLECANEKFWRPAYNEVDKANPLSVGVGDANNCTPSKQVCTLVPACTGDPFAAGAKECFSLSSPAKVHWMVDAQGRQPDKSGYMDPFYSPVDTEIDDDGVTLFDTPTLTRNFPLPRPAGASMPNPDETQVFTARDYVIIDDKVVATVQWTLTEKPNQDEVYAVPAVVPGPPSLQEQECFGQLLIHFHFSDAFTLPSDSNSNIKCTTPYY